MSAKIQANDGVLDFMSGIGRRETVKAGNEIAKGKSNLETPDYGQRKRNPMSSPDKKDRIINLEKENNTLKEKENLLQTEIMKMQTKLRRIEGLIRSRSAVGGESSTYDSHDLQKDLQNEFHSLKEQNETTKEKVRKLHVIQRGLASRPATAGKPNKYAHVQGKLEGQHGKVTTQYTQLTEDLRKQLVINQKEILRLQTEVNRVEEKVGGVGGPAGVERLRSEIQAMFADTRECNNEIEGLQGNFVQNETIFKQSKNYTAEIQKKIRETSEQNEHLKMANSRLHWKTQEITDLESEIRKIEEERDHLERSIRNVTTEPFLRKEGQNVQARIADLELKLKERSNVAQGLKVEEQKKSEVTNKLKTELQRLTGERDYLQGEHKKASEDFKGKISTKQGPNESDTLKGLQQMDAARYSQLMTDLAMGGANNAAPAWASLQFLERLPVESTLNDPKAQLMDEINKLRQEKSDFASELEKAQSLLRLQTDIEKENTVYFQQEIQRLSIIEKSSSAKLEELARRADEKARTVAELERKVNPNQGSSPARRSVAFEDDVQSEFSAVTNESAIRVDENILDFKIEDAELYQNVIMKTHSLADLGQNPNKPFVTLCTVDFYNHTTETSQMAEGMRPNYQTQFSFKNRVDDFYVAFLQKQSLKIDLYMSINNSAVHMGRCEVLLKDLIEREVAYVDSKTPLIQQWAKVYPIGQSNSQPLGSIKYKMRLRKPIQESMRYYREKHEIANMTKSAQLNTGTLQPQKKLVTISVVAAHNIKVKYSNVSEIAPFFYYQFFTFDERYSTNSSGINPRFEDSYSFEVTFDSRAINYFESESLEIILFDDNAPIAGQGADSVAGDDMIGICKVPLKSLIAGCSIHEKCPIRVPGGIETVGQLEVKLSVMDLERNQSTQFGKTVNDVTELNYGNEWEQDLVLRIARKLAKLNCEVHILFGIFSRGMLTTTKEDFKYCCLQRLGLRTEISERELDLFLVGNKIIKDKNYIESEDFIEIFEGAILQARHDLLNHDAFNETLSRDFNNTFGATNIHRVQSQAKLMQTYNETEVLQILADAVCRGSLERVNQEVDAQSQMGLLDPSRLRDILKRFALVPELDSSRITNVLEESGKIQISKFHQLLNQSLGFARERSSALKKLYTAFSKNGKQLVQRIENQDYSRDGVLSVEGFKAAVLVPESQMNSNEAQETFYLISHGGSVLNYREWISDNFPTYRQFLSNFQRADSSLTGRETSHYERSIKIEDSINIENDAPKLAQAKIKFENYIRSQDVNVGVIFAVLDTESNKAITLSDFKQKVKAMHMRLDDEEANALFRHLDLNNDGSISYNELVEMFSNINTTQIIKKMQKVILGSKVEPEFYFTKSCLSDTSKQKLNQGDFVKMVRGLYEKVTLPEIDQIFRHFDKGRKGYVTKAEFLQVFKSEIKETGQTGFVTTNIEDIIKPLATKVRKFNVNLSVLFDKYDRNKNLKLSAEELRDAFAADHGINLHDDEVRAIKDYFVNKFRAPQITKQAFIELLQTKFEVKSDSSEARKCLVDIRNKLEVMKKTPQRLLQEFNTDQTELINLRAFKMGISSLKVLTQYNIDNLARFMDKNNEGYISISEFSAAISNAFTADQTLKTQGTFNSTQRSNKWTTK